MQRRLEVKILTILAKLNDYKSKHWQFYAAFLNSSRMVAYERAPPCGQSEVLSAKTDIRDNILYFCKNKTEHRQTWPQAKESYSPLSMQRCTWREPPPNIWNGMHHSPTCTSTEQLNHSATGEFKMSRHHEHCKQKQTYFQTRFFSVRISYRERHNRNAYLIF